MIGYCAYQTLLCTVVGTKVNWVLTKPVKHIIMNSTSVDSSFYFTVNFNNGGYGIIVPGDKTIVVQDVNLPAGRTIYVKASAVPKRFVFSYCYDEDYL